MARECKGCGYKLKFCTCTDHRTRPDSEVLDQLRPLGRWTRAEKKAHERKCRAQGYRPLG
jgi:hypothetical protein